MIGILANSFENAVDGCLRCPDGTERFIAAKIAYSVYNGAGKATLSLKTHASIILSLKTASQITEARRGTGTKSISYTAEKYNGMVEFTAENAAFRTRVLLHLQNQT